MYIIGISSNLCCLVQQLLFYYWEAHSTNSKIIQQQIDWLFGGSHSYDSEYSVFQKFI
jgi:hypothetical protein